MFNFLKILNESIKLAYFELVKNKLRSFLTLLGITIGIFTIIAIFTAVDFLNSSVEDSFKEIGEDVVYVEKRPWVFTPDTPWWEFEKRDFVTYQNFLQLKEKLTTAEVVGYWAYGGNLNLKHYKTQLNDVPVLGITNGEEDILNIEMEYGRFFTESEERGANVMILGSEIANSMFGEDVDPTGLEIRMKGRKFNIIGVMRDKDNLLGVFDLREFAIIPHQYLRRIVKISKRHTEQSVGVKVAAGYNVEQTKDEIRGVMRGTRGLRPIESENYAINQVTVILEAIKGAQKILGGAGTFLGIFSLIIGGFGIANIMFVSVKERTKYIGVKKAIGAKQYVIMLEFLIESIFLCILGSLIGLGMVYGLTMLGPNYEFVNSIWQNKLIIGLLAAIVLVASLYFLYGEHKNESFMAIPKAKNRKTITLSVLFTALFLGFAFVTNFLAKALQNTSFTLSAKNIILGIVISVFIGILAGIIPAWLAARMDAVKAIRS